MSAEVTVDEMTCASVLWISLCRRGGSGNAGRRARACDRVCLFFLQESYSYSYPMLAPEANPNRLILGTWTQLFIPSF